MLLEEEQGELMAPGLRGCILSPPGLPRALLASRSGASRAVGWKLGEG